MYELLKEFIRPELLILVFALYLIGAGLKTFPNVGQAYSLDFGNHFYCLEFVIHSGNV